MFKLFISIVLAADDQRVGVDQKASERARNYLPMTLGWAKSHGLDRAVAPGLMAAMVFWLLTVQRFTGVEVAVFAYMGALSALAAAAAVHRAVRPQAWDRRRRWAFGVGAMVAIAAPYVVGVLTGMLHVSFG